MSKRGEKLSLLYSNNDYKGAVYALVDDWNIPYEEAVKKVLLVRKQREKSKVGNIMANEQLTEEEKVVLRELITKGYPSKQAYAIMKSQMAKKDKDQNPNQTDKMAPKAATAPQPVLRLQASETRIIETSLINKESIFRMCALAEATGLPLLLVGPMGTAKTKTVIEYAKAWLNKDGKMTNDDFVNKLFILETDNGTKQSEVKGMPDLERLFRENKFELAAPIAEAEVVVINEVDKASANIRNALLGVMNEKFLFTGKHKIPCKWKLFIATCNEIPKDETNSPFWDRFMLKKTTERVSKADMVSYYSQGDKKYKSTFSVGVPSKSDIASLSISVKKLEKFVDLTHNRLSDRTLTFVPNIARAVSFIWNLPIDQALVQTAAIMTDASTAATLRDKLYSSEMKALLSNIEILKTLNTSDQLDKHIAQIEGMITGYAAQNRIDASQVAEIEASINQIMEDHPVKKRNSDVENILEDLLSAQPSTV